MRYGRGAQNTTNYCSWKFHKVFLRNMLHEKHAEIVKFRSFSFVLMKFPACLLCVQAKNFLIQRELRIQETVVHSNIILFNARFWLIFLFVFVLLMMISCSKSQKKSYSKERTTFVGLSKKRKDFLNCRPRHPKILWFCFALRLSQFSQLVAHVQIRIFIWIIRIWLMSMHKSEILHFPSSSMRISFSIRVLAMDWNIFIRFFQPQSEFNHI